MGADIHSFAEVRRSGKWRRVTKKIFGDKDTEPFGWRSYAVFGFLADVRNYSHCAPIGETKGLPEDSEYLNKKIDDGWGGFTLERDEWQYGYHSLSYLTLKELLDFDYGQKFWDRRVSKQTSPNCWNGAALAEEGEGQTITYREHLGEWFFRDIDILKTLGAPEDVRVVFGFDN